MSYQQVLKFLNSLPNYEKNTNYSYQETIKLKRIQDFLAIIGNPQESLRVIHVAGTKGKGSTCAFVAYILRQAGFSVGLYTSPHLNDFRERIRILGPVVLKNRKTVQDFEGMISQVDLIKIVKELKPLINKYNFSSKYGLLSFFEIYTAIAFVYFFRKQADFVVLETGMGGRLDATNTVNPLVCAITPISLEHTQKLGKTLEKIAKEKAGIIKPEVSIVISASQKLAAAKIIRDQCKKSQAKLLEVGKHLKYFKTNASFLIQGLCGNYKNLKSPLIGDHQMANATLAVGLVETLKLYGFEVGASVIRQGVLKTIWPGRCEVVGKNPVVVLDGAQNLASAEILRTAIKDKFKYNKLILVLGISDDKDIAGICKTLEPLAHEIILTRANSKRAAHPKKFSSYFKRKVYLTSSVKEAKLLAKRLAGKKDLILVTGSLFVVGEYRDVKK